MLARSLTGLAMVACVACDEDARTCLVPSRLDLIHATMPDAHSATAYGEQSPDQYYLFAALDYESAPDTLVVDLHRGRGTVFADDFHAGTFALTGAQTNYATCDVCVLVFSDFDQATGPVGEPYFATSGELRLSSVDDTLVAGTLNDVFFSHVVLDETGAATADPDGCTTEITQLQFAAVPVHDD